MRDVILKINLINYLINKFGLVKLSKKFLFKIKVNIFIRENMKTCANEY